MTTDHKLLRHTVATLAYRAGKAIRGAPKNFGAFRCSAETRTPVEILTHMGDLVEWAASIAQGRETWRDAQPLAWDDEVQRFYNALKAFDDCLASGELLHQTPEKLFQGPLADALTHVGQLTMLRRMAGSPVKGENYFVAAIAAGEVGPEQPAPKREFD